MIVYSPIFYCAELQLACKGKITPEVADTLHYIKTLSSVECLHSNRTWKKISALHWDISYPLVTSFDQKMYALNGRSVKDFLATQRTQAAFVYDASLEEWIKLSDMPESSTSSKHGSVAVLGRKIYVMLVDEYVFSFDRILNEWQKLETKFPSGHACASVLAWKGYILVCGGRTNKEMDDDPHAHRTSVIRKFNQYTHEWSESTMKLPHKMSSHFVFPIVKKVANRVNKIYRK